MSNGFAKKSPTGSLSAKWLCHVTRRQYMQRVKTEIEALPSSSVRPPAEPPPNVTNLQPIMTGFNNPDNDADSIHSTNTFNTDDSTDSLFGMPPLACRFDDSSDDESSVPSLAHRSESSSDDDSHLIEVETVYSDTSYDTARDDDDLSISTTQSVPANYDDLGPPPPGSLMDLWDTPFSTSCLHNFPTRAEVSKCTFAGSDTTSDTASTDTFTDSSLELANDDDSYAAYNPICPHPVLSLTRVTATMQIANLDEPAENLIYHVSSKTTPRTPKTSSSELIDTGGNFNMTNRLDNLVNVRRIKPFSIGMAAKEDNSSSTCTHRGDFPLPMLDGSTFYTPVYYNEHASDCILSPEAICFASGGLLTKWNQSGSTEDNFGTVTFYNDKGAEVISLTLNKRNGLYYSNVSATAVGDTATSSHSRPDLDQFVYFHTPDGLEDDEVSLDFDEGDFIPSSAPTVNRNARPTLHGPKPTGPTMSPMSVPTPKSTPPQFDPKYKQLEADLWQARLGHCSDWQLKVIPMSADGTPSKFSPHPFASYDVYNQARIRKRPATRGKHPSRAVTSKQRWYMDFGFMRASQADYSRPDKTKDRVVTSYDGYNSYLLVVDESTKYTWVYLCQSKEPPISLIEMHLDQFGHASGYIRTDQGGELAGCAEFITAMAIRKFVVEPTGADSPNQNKQAERYNDTFGVTVRVLLYGSGLPATFWSAALIHAAYLHNRRVHKTILMTPFEAWNGFKPDLRTLRVFGSRVCVKRTGKRRSKLDRHDFTGIFIGYTATDENIKYIDVNTRMEKSCHHAIFDEAWYLQPKRPPFAQMLYDVGLEPDEEIVIPTSSPIELPPFPPMATSKPKELPRQTVVVPLPLRLSTPSYVYAAAAAKSTIVDDLVLQDNSKLPSKRLEHEMMLQHDITSKEMEMVYLSPSPYNNAFEEELDLRRYNPTTSPTAGIVCSEKSSKLFLKEMQRSTPAAKIRAWRSRLRGARILEVDGVAVNTIQELSARLLTLKDSGAIKCTILMAHSAIRDGLVESGIPQVNIDQLNDRHSFMSLDVMTQEQFDAWFANLPSCFYEIVNDGGVLNLTTECHKLTRKVLLQQDDWNDWRDSEHLQLDQYEQQYMFGTPVKPTKKSAVFNLIWTYLIKKEDGRKKARCTCDGSTRGGQVRVLDYTYANSLDQTGSRLFYATSTAENMMCFGADVSNAFGDAPPPKQGFFIRPDKAFREWWISKGREPIPEGYVIPVLAAMQGHPESPRLWEKHIDKILRVHLGFVPTVHEPCVYNGEIDGQRVMFKRQVDDFLLAAHSAAIANKVWDLIDAHLRMPMKRYGLVSMYNGLDILQSRWYVKISIKTWLTLMMEPYFADWLDIPTTPMPTPFGPNEAFIKRLYTTEGNPDKKVQAQLEKQFRFGYRKAIGQLIWPMTTCRPDLCQSVVKLAQHSAAPAEVHYCGVKSVFRYLAATMDDGIYFWRTAPVMELPDDPLPKIWSTPHDIKMAGRPRDEALVLSGSMDSGWGNCLLTRRSFGGVMMRLAGGPVAWKGKLQPTVAGSSTEAEFMMSYDGGRMSLYLRSILWDLGVPQDAATILYEDNDGATAMANAGKPTPRSRHIDIKFYSIQEWVERDLVILQRIDTAQNPADHLTKVLSRILFYRHRDFYMGHVPPTYSPRYNEVARVYTLDDPANPVSGEPHVVAARAAKSLAPWDIVIQSMYLLPSADLRSNSTSSLERGGVTDTYDLGTLVSTPEYLCV